ncbi:peptidyl-prolyl cis-trans isomerase FKBP12-like [Xenia sp. Carnegie-2017]|uniref:peptidyl-prolyl cis-trans isomerase FKBP12-like n=1 Tax=Xenia sp. Carnegie-2017 TaxID=2897299 RepID=UPI001F03F791|nr:peptidyl-prolyl cis-trans isomerase FKBP12-like [Xenia sp. Carnegie-2017]
MAEKISEGVTKEILRPGNGKMPKSGDTITVNCTGSLVDSQKKFWSTHDEGQKPFSFQVGKRRVIAGWDEGCLTMKEGEKARLVLQAHKAYGTTGFPAWNIPPNAPLQFDIELLKIN